MVYQRHNDRSCILRKNRTKMSWMCCNKDSVDVGVENPTEIGPRTTSDDPASHSISTSTNSIPAIPGDDADILDPQILKKMNKEELSNKVTKLAGDSKKAKEAIVKNQEEISFLTKARDNDHEEMTKLLDEKDEVIEALIKDLEQLKKSIEDQDRKQAQKQSVIVSDDENSRSEEHDSVKLLLSDHSVEAISLPDEENNNDSKKLSEGSNDIPKEIFKKSDSNPDIISSGKTNDKATDLKEFNLAEETLGESGSGMKLPSLSSSDALITKAETKENIEMDYAVHGDNQAIPMYDDKLNTDFHKLKNDYEKMSYALTQSRHKNDKLSSQITKLELHHTRDSLKKEIVLQSTVRESKCKIKSLSQRITELKRLYDDSRKEIAMKDERIITLAARIDSSKDGTGSVKVEWETALNKALAGNDLYVRKVETLEGDIQMAREDAKRKDKRIKDLERELGDLHCQLALATATTTFAELVDKENRAHSPIIEGEVEMLTLVQKPKGENDDDCDKDRQRNDTVALEAENKVLSLKVDGLELANKETNDEMEKKCVELDSLRNDTVALEAENKVLLSKVNELELANKETNGESEKKCVELDSLRKDTVALEAENNVISSNIDELELANKEINDEPKKTHLMTDVDKKTKSVLQKLQKTEDDDVDNRQKTNTAKLEEENTVLSSMVDYLERVNRETNDKLEKKQAEVNSFMNELENVRSSELKTKSVLQKLQKTEDDDVDNRQKIHTAKLEEENKALSSMVNDLEIVNRETNDKLEKKQAEVNSLMVELENVRSSELNVKNENEEIYACTTTVETTPKTTTTTISKDDSSSTLPPSLEALQKRNSQLKLMNIALKVTLKKERTTKALTILNAIKTIETERRRKEFLMKNMEDRLDDLNRQLNDSLDILKGYEETMAAKEEEFKGMMDEMKRKEEIIEDLERGWRKKEGEMGQTSRKYSTTSRRDFSLICSLRKDLQDARSQSQLLQQQLDETSNELGNVTRDRNLTKTKIKFLNSGKKLKIGRRGGDIRLSENICVCIRVRPNREGDLQHQQQSTRRVLSPSHSKRSPMSPGISISSVGVGLPPLTSQGPFRFPGMDTASTTTTDDNSIFSSGGATSSSPSYNIALVEPYKDRGGLSPTRKTYKFEFDHIFPPNSTQDDIWHTVADSFIDNVITGENVCIFSYGMSGSGKSYTLFGEPNKVGGGGDEGIVYRSAKTLFQVKENLEKEEEDIEVDIFVEFVEICNEKVNDLLVETTMSSDTDSTTTSHGNSSSVISIVSDSSNTTTPGSSGHGGPRCARCLEDVMKLLSMTTAPQKKSGGRKKRHLVLTFHFIVNDLKKSNTKDGSRGYKGQLRIFDLASGGRVGNYMDENARKETQYINLSQSALTTLIEKLKSSSSSKDTNATTHIPYRNSKLTQMLYESLQGDSKTLAIICCSPLSSHMNESLSSLRFAAKLMTKKGNDDDGSDSRYGDLRSPSVKKMLLY